MRFQKINPTYLYLFIYSVVSLRYCSDIPTICLIKSENLAQKHLIKNSQVPSQVCINGCPLHEAKKKSLAELYTSLGNLRGDPENQLPC